MENQAWKIAVLNIEFNRMTGLASEFRHTGFMKETVNTKLNGKPYLKNTDIFNYKQMMEILSRHYDPAGGDPLARLPDHYEDELRALKRISLKPQQNPKCPAN